MRKGCFGSGPDLWRDPQDGLLPGVKPTESVGKRTRPLECQLLGVVRTYPDQGLNRRS